MTTTWREALSYVTDHDDYDPILDEQQSRKDALAAAAWELGADDVDVDYAFPPGGRLLLEEYAWTVTTWYWHEGTAGYKSPKTFQGTYQAVLDEIRAYKLPEGYLP